MQQQSVFPGFEFLLMETKEIMTEYINANTVGEVNDMLLKICGEALNDTVSDSEFREMILKLMRKKAELTASL